MSNQDVSIFRWKEEREKLTGWPVKKRALLYNWNLTENSFSEVPLDLVLPALFQPEEGQKFRIQKVLGFMACDNGQCHIFLLSITLRYSQNLIKVDCK
jgi:hypothetical protein